MITMVSNQYFPKFTSIVYFFIDVFCIYYRIMEVLSMPILETYEAITRYYTANTGEM